MAMALRSGPVAPVCYLAGNAQPRRLTNTNAWPPNVETAAHLLRYHAPVTRRRACDATIITVMLYPRMTTPPPNLTNITCFVFLTRLGTNQVMVASFRAKELHSAKSHCVIHFGLCQPFKGLVTIRSSYFKNH
jgi:hypothetical protein